jgi:thiamine-monophosphate kinase
LSSPEFDLIARYFSPPTRHTHLAGGDDGALIQLEAGKEMVVSTDMLVEGTHFFAGTDPGRLGRKALAVNLSDLAAMGARPRWVTLSLALPAADDRWLAPFAEGFLTLAAQHEVDLVGGDTTRGRLNICVQIMGDIPVGRALRRDGARVGDTVWVSGTLGDAALALGYLKKELNVAEEDLGFLLDRLETPAPRVELGQRLLGLASAAIDVSDGLLADLGHICRRSRVGAVIEAEKLPRSSALARNADRSAGTLLQLSGGDDYELCFTAPAGSRRRLMELAAELAIPLTPIGSTVAVQDVQVLDGAGTRMHVARRGFDHFG